LLDAAELKVLLGKLASKIWPHEGEVTKAAFGVKSLMTSPGVVMLGTSHSDFGVTRSMLVLPPPLLQHQIQRCSKTTIKK
jgi:hypothetical protein